MGPEEDVLGGGVEETGMLTQPVKRFSLFHWLSPAEVCGSAAVVETTMGKKYTLE